MKKYIIIFLLVSFCSADQAEDEIDIKIVNESTTTIGVTMNDKVYDKQPDMGLNTDSTYSAVIKTNFGEMTVEFFTDDAPLTVNNFVTLSNDGYYDSVIFHRVISGFMIQGGDPSGTGHGDYGKFPGYEFEDELNNQRPYEKGILAMANRGPDTNGSQFFIMHADYPLPYSYTIFGKVTDGLEVVDKIAAVETDSADKPTEDVIISTVEILEN
jgi:cyclophilin family peptidyl-prolyl cis-trans isomerase|tara:strand:+ start:2314 stop:2952 length:639 start_codon:yes stop_codon:yes gene_type:complete